MTDGYWQGFPQDQECFKLERRRHPKGHPYTQGTRPSELRT